MKNLYDYLRAAAHTPFAWGVHDCCLMAADAVAVQTGTDPAADLRGTYHDRASADAVLALHGGLTALCDARFGPRVPVKLAQRGSIVLFEELGHEALGVMVDVHIAGAGERGIVRYRRSRALIAWRPA